MVEKLKYQVALSFAGEQREYVNEVARHLESRGIAVFYDGFETVQLWGLHCTEAFHKAFAEQSAHVVMFISKQYVEKAWPQFERRAALSRMIKENRDYILPVRFDDAIVPGLPDDIGYLSVGVLNPAQLSASISEKLGINLFYGKASDLPAPIMTSSIGEVVFDYASHSGRFVIGSGQLAFETKWSKASNTSIYIYNDPPSINGIAIALQFSLISQVRNAEALDFTSRSRKPCLDQIIVLRNKEGFYAALHVLEIKDGTRDDDHDEIRFRYAIQSDGSDNFENFGQI